MQFGKYTLLDKLGDGGMAEVFLAQISGPEGFTKLVALKRILPHLNQDSLFTQSFINEARLGGYLNHHNIVQTLEFGQEQQFYYLAMEYVRGVTLADVLEATRKRGEPMPTELALQVAIQIAEGLAYAHHAEDADGRPLRMVHRDLKPSNILINNHGVCKIADFGVARSESNIAQTMLAGEVKGTVCYMSPEQALGSRDLDNRSDLYSLGAICFEMLTNERLYPEESYLLSLRQVQDGQVADRLPMLLELPEGLRIYQVLSRMLAADRTERYSDALEFARDVREVLAAFSLDWELSDYLKALLPNSPLTNRGTQVSLPVAAMAMSSGRHAAVGGANLAMGAAGLPVSSSPGLRIPSTPGLHPSSDPRLSTGEAPSEQTLNPQPLVTPPHGTTVSLGAASPTLEISQTMTARPARPLWKRPELWIVAVVLLITTGVLYYKLVLKAGYNVPVTSIPLGATLTTSAGLPLGTTPIKVQVPPEGLSLKASLEGYEAQTISLEGSGRQEPVVVRFVQVPATLVIQVEPPGAKLELDGQPLTGRPPFRQEGLTAGKHIIQARLEGYDQLEQPIELKAGEEQTVALIMVPVKTTPPPEVVKPPPKPPVQVADHRPPIRQKPPVEPKKPVQEPARPAPMGYLTVNTFPYSRVEIDGAFVKMTPVINHPLPAGAHKVRFTTEDGRVAERSYAIKVGEQTKDIVRFD